MAKQLNAYEGNVYRRDDDIATFVCVAFTKREARELVGKHLALFDVVSPQIEIVCRRSPVLDALDPRGKPQVVIFRMDQEPRAYMVRNIPEPSEN